MHLVHDLDRIEVHLVHLLNRIGCTSCTGSIAPVHLVHYLDRAGVHLVHPRMMQPDPAPGTLYCMHAFV